MSITPQMYQAAQLTLQALGAQPTSVGINLLVAWMVEEDGYGSTLPCHNPMNSTLPMPGSHTINSEGVQCYPSVSEGIAATVSTLKEYRYPTLLQAIKTGDANLFFSSEGRAELETWLGKSDPSYPNAIFSIYQSLPSVPSQYLTSTSSGGSSPFIPPTIPTASGLLFLIAGLALGAFAIEFGVFEQREKRQTGRWFEWKPLH